MSINFKHLETIRLPNKVTSSFPCTFSENGQIAIVTFNCVFILHPYPSKDNSLLTMSMKKLCIQASNFALSSNVGINVNDIIDHLSKVEIFEAVLRTELSAQLNCGMNVEGRIIKAAWSPSCLVDDYDCAIATLSNLNSLEIWIKKINNAYYEEYVSVCNITQKYVEVNSLLWKDVSKATPNEQFSELICRIEKIRPTAFTWSPIITTTGGQFCILLVGHYSGTITFWKVNTFKSSNISLPEIILLGESSVNLKHITSILWKQADNTALVFMGSVEGQVAVISVNNITEDGVDVGDVLILWPEIDLIRIDHISLITHEKHIFVFIVKGSDLVISMIDERGFNIDTCVFHVGNVMITGLIQNAADKILVMSLSGALKELKLSCVNEKINVEWRHLYVNINWYINQCLGIVASKNKVYFGFLTGPCKTADSKDDKILNDFVIFTNTENNPLDILLSNNSSQSFRDYWDCLETFRVSCLLEKNFPCAKFTSDFASLYKLKIHLWAAAIFEAVCELTTNVKTSMKTQDELQQIMSVEMIIFRMKFLLKLHASGKSLSNFQLENLLILNNNLKRIVLEEDMLRKLEFGDGALMEIIQVMAVANGLKYPPPSVCWTCGENILDVVCFPPHFRAQCAISFMQIERYPCYRCSFCKCVAREEVEEEVGIVLCPFCEVPMAKTRINIVDSERDLRFRKVSEYCTNDCVTTVTKIGEVEEHAFANENKVS